VTSRAPWRIAFLAALLVQVWALYWPRQPSVDTGLPLDKVVHFGLFAVVTYAGVHAGISRWLVAVIMVGQAVLSETVQHFLLAQRSGDVWDLVADVAGITVALWVTRDRPHRVDTMPDTT
jgi:VanZ family protein